MEKTINRRAVFADIHQDTRGGEPHVFSIRYVKRDGTLGQKARVSKTTRAGVPRRLGGERGYRGNVNLNHVLLLQNLDSGHPFEVHIDLLTHYNDMRINHTR